MEPSADGGSAFSTAARTIFARPGSRWAIAARSAASIAAGGRRPGSTSGMSFADRLVEGFAGSASRALADRTLALALLAAAEERQVPVGARWEYGPVLEVGTSRLGTLAFAPGVVYRASALDEEGAAGDGDNGRAAG
jgi:hypothetical protein